MGGSIPEGVLERGHFVINNEAAKMVQDEDTFMGSC